MEGAVQLLLQPAGGATAWATALRTANPEPSSSFLLGLDTVRVGVTTLLCHAPCGNWGGTGQ